MRVFAAARALAGREYGWYSRRAYSARGSEIHARRIHRHDAGAGKASLRRRDGLRNICATHVEGFAGPLEVEQFKGGQSNPTFLLRSRAALRPAPQAARQAVALRPRRGPRISRHLRVVSCRHSGGAHLGAVRRRRSDRHRVLHHGLRRRPRAVGSGAARHGKGRAHGDFRRDEPRDRGAAQVDYATIGLGDYGKPGNYLERQISRWIKQYRASETEKIEAMDKLIEWLPQHIPPQERPASCTATTGWTT